MTAKAPTSHQIAELADQRTSQFFGPPDAPVGYSSAAAWAEQRRQVYAEQLSSARAELFRKFEAARDRENERAAIAQAQVDAREAELRRRFDTRFPGGSDADFQALRPAFLAELSAEADRVERDGVAESRRRVRI